MVEAIESNFVPVLIYNNKKEHEGILKKYNEPSWNNPVVRYLDAEGQDIIPRKDRVWTTSGVAKQTARAIEASGKSAPAYLKLIAQGANEKKTETAEFAMHCYWEGEAKLGSITGVKDTRSGWRGNLEVVQVEFHPELVDYSELLKAAQSFECASKIYTHNERQKKVASKTAAGKIVDVAADPKMRDAKLSDQMYYVRHSILGRLPLTSRQATKINSALYLKKPYKDVLSPRQVELLKRLKDIHDADKDALREFVWPDDDTRLPEYQSKLLCKIKELNL